MSDLSGNQNSDDSVNQQDWSRVTSDSPTGNPFQKQALSITHRFEYRSPGQLVEAITMIIDFDSTVQSFAYFAGITDRDFEAIETQLMIVQLRSAVRFTFDNYLNAAIVRIMPGPEHGCIACELYREIVRKIESIPGHLYSICAVCATRFKVPGVGSKEGDQGLRPDTRVGRDAWPSLMIEVGYSERQNLLQLDPEWWLLHSQGRTRFVIIAIISHDPFSLRIECWKMGTPLGEHDVAVRIPKCIQDFNIDSAGQVSSPLGSPELLIPYDCIFDRSSLTSQPIILTIPELSFFAKRMFALLQ